MLEGVAILAWLEVPSPKEVFEFVAPLVRVIVSVHFTNVVENYA